MIGIFDSGLGGLGIFRKIKLFLPYEDIFYYADNKNLPYGKKSKQELKKLTLNAIKYLENKGCDIIVIACNTATTAGIEYFRKHSRAHLIGVVPVIKSAAKIAENKKIALLATPSTVKSKYVDKLIKIHAKNYGVKKIGCKNWVNAIEQNKITDKIIRSYTRNIKDESVIILGCTHFTLIKGHIQRIVGPDKIVMSSNDAVARHTMRVGMKYNLLKKRKRIAKYTFDCSANKKEFLKRVNDYVHYKN